MSNPSFRDLSDYIGGAGTSNYVICFDAGGRLTQAPVVGLGANPTFSTLNIQGIDSAARLNVPGIFSAGTSRISFFGVASVAQQRLLAAANVAHTSADAANSALAALAFNSLGVAINSINLFFRNYGLQSTG